MTIYSEIVIMDGNLPQGEVIDMARQLTQKRFKVEIEITVGMDAVQPGAAEASESQALAQLQQALLADEPALRQQLLAAAFGQLQAHCDYLAGQEHITRLAALASGLDPEDQEPLGLTQADLVDATRPLRVDSLTTQVNSCCIQEQIPGEEPCSTWQPVWTDLRPQSELGFQLEGLAVPSTPVPPAGYGQENHYLLLRYLTAQPDGVHVEGSCTCGKTIVGVGADEDQALSAAWGDFNRHYRVTRIGEQMQLGLHGSCTQQEQ